MYGRDLRPGVLLPAAATLSALQEAVREAALFYLRQAEREPAAVGH